MSLRSIPLVLAVAIALSACQASAPGLVPPAVVPADTAAAAAVSGPEVRTFSGIATFQGQPLSGFDVRVYDAVTDQPLPRVGTFSGPQARRYTLSSLEGGSGPSVLDQGLVTDEQGRYHLLVGGFAPGQAVRVVIAKGDVSSETIITADAEDLDPLVTNEVDDSYLVGDAETARLLNPEGTPPVPMAELVADPALLQLSAAELGTFVTEGDVDDAMIQGAIARGELDAAGYAAALTAEIEAGEALLDAGDTAAVQGGGLEGAVVAEADGPAAAGYVLLANGLFAPRGLLAAKPLPGLPPLVTKLPAKPTGTLVKAPDGKPRLEVPVKPLQLGSKQQARSEQEARADFEQQLNALLVDLSREQENKLREAYRRAGPRATQQQLAQIEKEVKAQCGQRLKELVAVRKDPVSRTLAQLMAVGAKTGKSPVDVIHEQLKAETAKRAQAKASTVTNLKRLADERAAALREAAARKKAAASALLKGQPVLSAKERLALAAQEKKRQEESAARLKAAGLTPPKPTLVRKPDGTMVAVVEPRIERRVNEVTTTQAKLVAPVLATSRVLAPKAASAVITKATQEIRALTPSLKQAFQSNPNAARELMNAKERNPQTLSRIVSSAGVERKTAQIVTSLVSDIAQQSKDPAKRSPAASDPAVVASLTKIALPGTAFTTTFDPTQGLTLTNSATGQSVDAASASAVASAVSSSQPRTSSGSSAPSGPQVTALSATGFVVGETLTITGTAFSATADQNVVSFNGTTATPSAATATSLTVTVPADATSGDLTVTTGGRASNATAYFVYQPYASLTTTTYASGLKIYGGQGQGMAVDASDNVFVVQNDVGNLGGLGPKVTRHDAAGAVTATFQPNVATIPQLSAVAIRNGLVYVAVGRHFNSSAETNKVVRWNPDDDSFSTFVTGVANPAGLAFDSAGNLYVASVTDRAVYKYDTAGALVGTVTSGMTEEPAGLAIDKDDTLYIAGFNIPTATSGKTIYKVPAGGTRSVFYNVATDYEPQSLCFDAKGFLWVTQYNTSKITRISPAGVGTTWATGLGGPNGIAIDSNGNVFATLNNNTVQKTVGAAPLSN